MRRVVQSTVSFVLLAGAVACYRLPLHIRENDATGYEEVGIPTIEAVEYTPNGRDLRVLMEAPGYVTVIVVETVPPVFYVMGEVNQPGTLPLKGQISAVQALAMAGGFKDFAKKKDILIQRKGAAGVTTSVPFNYNDAIKGKGSMVYIQPGDTIIVP